MQKRGMLTERIEDKSSELLGYKMDVGELRLMPYVMFVMQNGQTLDGRRLNEEDEDILTTWENDHYIEMDERLNITVTEEFWDIMSEIVYLGYVDVE